VGGSHRDRRVRRQISKPRIATHWIRIRQPDRRAMCLPAWAMPEWCPASIFSWSTPTGQYFTFLGGTYNLYSYAFITSTGEQIGSGSDSCSI
jgi:hypothetical protein